MAAKLKLTSMALCGAGV